MPKRICLIRQGEYPYDPGLRREARTLQQAGFETHVICLSSNHRGNHQHEDGVAGVHVHRLPLARRKAGVARYLYDYLRFTFLAGLQVTLLHLRHPFAAAQVSTMPDFVPFATLIPRLLGVKIVVKMQEPVPELWETINRKPPPHILRWVEQAALGYGHAALTVTQQLKDLYVSRGADASKISVILNVPECDFRDLGEGQAEAGKDPEHFILICHGAIERRYGHATMLEAMALLKSEIPNLRLRVTGEGSYVEKFLAHRSRLGLEDHVDYLGWVTLPQVVHELQAADVGIVAQESSLYANLVHTHKMFEYIYFGKPVLHSRLGAVEAYFDDESLLFFEPGDPESLARGVQELYRDPEKRRMLLDNSQRLYKQYNWQTQKKIYLSVYSELLE